MQGSFPWKIDLHQSVYLRCNSQSANIFALALQRLLQKLWEFLTNLTKIGVVCLGENSNSESEIANIGF